MVLATMAEMMGRLDMAREVLVPLQALPMSDDDRAELERQLRANAKLRELVEKLQKVWA